MFELGGREGGEFVRERRDQEAFCEKAKESGERFPAEIEREETEETGKEKTFVERSERGDFEAFKREGRAEEGTKAAKSA